jgi:hypothetical protein
MGAFFFFQDFTIIVIFGEIDDVLLLIYIFYSLYNYHTKNFFLPLVCCGFPNVFLALYHLTGSKRSFNSLINLPFYSVMYYFSLQLFNIYYAFFSLTYSHDISVLIYQYHHFQNAQFENCTFK